MASRQEILNIIANDEQLSAVTAAVFTQADTDGSGHINRSELKTALVDVANGLNIPPPTEAEIDKAFTALDVNRDGHLSVEEFKVVVKETLEAIAALDPAE